MTVESFGQAFVIYSKKIQIIPIMKTAVLIFLISFLSISLVQGQSFYNFHHQPKHSVALGVGPSFMYADNAGRISKFDVKIRPAITAAYMYRISPFVSLRASIGTQWLESNTQVDQRTKERWGERNQAFAFQGISYFADVMPIIHLFPENYNPHALNFYGGVGIGALQVYRTQQIMVFEQPRSEDGFTQTAYIPVRLGIARALNRDWKVGLEASFFYTFSDEIDGNVGYNSHGNDFLIQAQVMVRRSFF
jgi:hypothetical protein